MWIKIKQKKISLNKIAIILFRYNPRLSLRNESRKNGVNGYVSLLREQLSLICLKNIVSFFFLLNLSTTVAPVSALIVKVKCAQTSSN